MNLLTDLRSDTVTRPTPAMLEAMFSAKVGDDVYEEDPTVHALEQKAAALFGKEAALFCPTGTMTNQIAIKLHTQPGDDVLCDQLAHIYQYEGGGIAFNSGASVRLLQGERGRFTAQQVQESINEDNVHFPRTRLVSAENTVNKGGGCVNPLPELAKIGAVCRANNLAFHLDGARVFNALVAAGLHPQAYGQVFDTISICLSKGLGAPVGSLLVGTQAHIKQAKRIRKVLGGGWRQAGYLAAAGLFALENHVNRLSEDHARAAVLAADIATLSYITEVYPQETNIVIFRLADGIAPKDFMAYLAGQNVLVSGFGKQLVRLVTHLDFSDDMLQHTLHSLRNFRPRVTDLPAQTG